jgi:hypothetical protein
VRLLKLIIAVTGVLALLVGASTAPAKTSHAGWPSIDGFLIIHKADQDGEIVGHPAKHNELLGGHGNDVIRAGNAGDVLWGDHKPRGNTTRQHDEIFGGQGKDFIYASHGRNVIWSGGGPDQVHVHFGRGAVHCQSPDAVVFISHHSRAHYRLHGCRHISYKTLGY